ncbi:MAG: phenylacetate--CoA ligase family protein [Acidobacteria bacterium]|nr:phenylacetate--CoA ligase family protein [Acidobacteriota bacterium]
MEPGYRVSAADLARFALPAIAQARRQERWDPARAEAWQLARVREVVAHALEHVPLHRERLRAAGVVPREMRSLADLQAIPVLERAELAASARRALSEEAWPGREKLSVVRTSGSTGEPLAVYVDGREVAISLGLILHGWLRCGLRPGDRLAYLCVPGRTTPARPGGRLLRVHPVDLRASPPDCLAELERIRPRVIYGFPSVLEHLAREALARGRRLRGLRLAIVHGEVLAVAARDRIRRGLGCVVRDTYGSAEFNRLAWECEHGTLHIVPSAAIVETGPGGEILVTSLYHRTMPFLRYRIGDRGQVSVAPCPCGRTTGRLDAIEGRDDDTLTLPSGRKVSARAINLLEEVPGVLEYQVVQRAPDRVEVLARLSSAFAAAEAAQVASIIRGGFQGEEVNVRVIPVDVVPRGPTGKRRAVVSEVR